MKLVHIPVLALAVLLAWQEWVWAKSGPQKYLKQPEAWFAGDQAGRIADNILSFQSDLGGWPKNTDTAVAPFTGSPESLRPTFDNSATTDELRFLARVYTATRQEKYQKAFDQGLDYILKAQYPCGGWPQSFPPDRSYHRYITFNDDAMVRLLEFLREIGDQKRYGFLDSSRVSAASRAFERGIQCILNCQIKVGGKLTAWCAQHDEKDFSPRQGRTFEPVSLSSGESAGITRLLMSLKNPSPEVVRAVEGAMAWFKAVKLEGIRVVGTKAPDSAKGIYKVVVQDREAPTLWARFYEIGSDRPIFADRDGVKKYSLIEIGYERRNGYAWYGVWPGKLLDKEYPAWRDEQK